MQVEEVTVLDLASSELEFFRSLKKLIMKSTEHIESENMDDLMHVLKEKQNMISQYNVILEEWNKIGTSLEIKDGYNNPDFWRSLFNMFSAGSSEKGCFSDKLELFIEQRKTLVEELLKMEDDAREVLNEYVKRLRSRISQISKGRDACKGYAAAGGASLSSH